MRTILPLHRRPCCSSVRPLAGAQTPDDLFDSRTLQEVRLYIHSSDLAQLRERYLEDTYYPADFEWRGIRARNIGVRVRGLATRSPIKPGLRIDFDRYVAQQTFLGMSALVLDNALKDPSMIRERTSMAFIKRMGQPAPRESFARVFINGSYEGVYALVEAIGQRVSGAGALATGWDISSSTSSRTVSTASISATTTSPTSCASPPRRIVSRATTRCMRPFASSSAR